MTRIFFLETELRAIQKAALGASKMTRRLSYIYEIAAAALEQRPFNEDFKEPRERSLQWKGCEFPPERPGYYVARTNLGSPFVALWDERRWLGPGLTPVDYLSLRLPMERK